MSCADCTASWAFNVNLSKRTICFYLTFRKRWGRRCDRPPGFLTTPSRAAAGQKRARARENLLSVAGARNVHLHLTRLGFFALRQGDGQNAVFVFGGDRFRVQRIRQREAAAERAVGALHAQEILLRYGLVKLTLPMNREQVFLDAHV